MNNFIKTYDEQIEKTNKDIGKVSGWGEYILKFKKVNEKLYNNIIRLLPYEVRTLKNEYLKNWVKNFQNTHKESE